MLKKDIAFIYMDSAEKSFMQLIADEAEKRGYSTNVTNDPFVRCEIGVYCQHINFPQYSKFSMIMLHDIIQQYGRWPDIWYLEPWNKYDIGILPSNQWVENWQASSQWFYTRPRLGIFKVGWPKADIVANTNKEAYRKQFYEKWGLDLEKKTILYAPAWENDNKQDDFVRAMKGLDVNVIIKQWDANPEKFPEVVANIKEMYELHKNEEGVKILPPSMNIFDAIMAADILVSEESSTMSEAAMVGIPAVSVTNWLIPDTTPHRLPECHYDFVTKTTKEELRECIKNMTTNYVFFKKQTEEYCHNNFSNIGSSCSMIMDILDDCVEGKTIRYSPLVPQEKKRVPFTKELKRKYEQFYRSLYANYKEQYPAFGCMWNVLKKVKDSLVQMHRE